MDGSRPAILFNAEEEYSQAYDLVLHLMGPGRYAVLRPNETITVDRYQ